MPPFESLPSEQAAFAKHLFTQGYPLWSPDPVLLPAARQSVGLKIGDVGTVDERGRFELFFNILEPSPGISGSLPLNFPPIVENDTRCLDEDLLPREVVSSPGTPWDVDQLDILTLPDISRRTTQYSATLSNDGSHIILPQGAQLFELRSQHKKLFESHAKEHGAEWLELFKDQLGWPRSNSLYLLTGVYKTCSWSIASFDLQTAANTNPVYVYCTLLEVDERTIRNESVWHPAGLFKRKIGPAPDRQGQNNQTVFVRGITITPNVSKQSQNEEQPTTSSVLNQFITRTPFLKNLMGSAEASATQTPTSNVIIQHVPSISQVSHPSEMINRYLLTKEPSATIAVTHDCEWISMLEMLGEGRSWTLEDLESRLDTLVSGHYSIVRHNGTVYLRDEEHRSLTDFAVERPPDRSSSSSSRIMESETLLSQPTTARSSTSYPEMGLQSSVDENEDQFSEPPFKRDNRTPLGQGDDQAQSNYYTATSRQQNAPVIGNSSYSELHWTGGPHRENYAPAGLASNTSSRSSIAYPDPSSVRGVEPGDQRLDDTRLGSMFGALEGNAHESWMDLAGMEVSAPVSEQAFPAASMASPAFRPYPQAPDPFWHPTYPVHTVGQHSDHDSSIGSLAMRPVFQSPTSSVITRRSERRLMPANLLPSITTPNFVRPLRFNPVPVASTSSSSRSRGERYLDETTLQCMWTSRCTELIASDRRSVTNHLRDGHNFTCDGQVIACAWGECQAHMQRRNIPRHIVACHSAIKAICPHCGLSLSRVDAMKTHLLACTAVEMPAVTEEASEENDVDISA